MRSGKYAPDMIDLPPIEELCDTYEMSPMGLHKYHSPWHVMQERIEDTGNKYIEYFTCVERGFLWLPTPQYIVSFSTLRNAISFVRSISKENRFSLEGNVIFVNDAIKMSVPADKVFYPWVKKPLSNLASRVEESLPMSLRKEIEASGKRVVVR